jgi:site-specific DNA recombinase
MYVRVSSKEQEQGFSIPAQRQLLKDYAEREGIHVVQEFEDVETAKRAGRTSFSEMVDFLRKKTRGAERCWWRRRIASTATSRTG